MQLFFYQNGCADELEKIVHQTSKEHLLLEKQVSQKIEVSEGPHFNFAKRTFVD